MCIPHRQTIHASHKRISVMQITSISLISTHKIAISLWGKEGQKTIKKKIRLLTLLTTNPSDIKVEIILSK